MVRPHRKARIASRIWTVVVGVLLTMVARAEENKNSHKDLVKSWEPMQDYLNQYGYLIPSPFGADNLRTEDKLRDAIRNMQRFGGLPPTGIVDDKTLTLLQRKRCGMPDMSPSERVRRFAIQGQNWTKKDLTWSIQRYPTGLHSGHVRREVSNAFKVWSDVSLLNFREVSGTDADIIVSFEKGHHGDGYPFDGEGTVLAHAFFPGQGIGGDAHFDADEPWVDSKPDSGKGVRLFAVAAHEFGHSLGLSHSSVSGALMNPFYQPIDDNFELPNDDVMGIQRLYGPRHPNRFAPIFPNIPKTRPVFTPSRRPPTDRGTYAPTRTRPPQPQPPPPPSATQRPYPQDPIEPSKCNTTFDAISVIRGQLFIFKGKYFWRFDQTGKMMGSHPGEVAQFWNDTQLINIDAVYERTVGNHEIVFFSGAQYWMFAGNTKMPGYPRPLTDLGLPPDLKKIDAAMVWGHNGKTYFFAGKQYWRYDEQEGRVELDYPRDMAMWRGVPYHIDAAFKTSDGTTYFFKGRKFWEFQNNLMKVKKNKYSNINEFWFGCPSHHEQAPDIEDSEQDSISVSRCSYVVPDSFLLLSFAIVFLLQRTTQILYL